MNIKHRLIVLNFLQYAIWGSYLTSMGTYLAGIGLASKIGLFYAMQGIVSLFMPALMGIVADRWIQAQRLLGYCHLLATGFMAAAGVYALSVPQAEFAALFTLYACSVAFYMPTIALSNSVAYNALEVRGLDPEITFPPIRIWGTIGFIAAMWCCDIAGFQSTPYQFLQCAALGLVMGFYSMTMPACEIRRSDDKASLIDALGLKAFALFKEKRMALFFIFSMLLGVSLQITNGFANPFISAFGGIAEYADTFGVQHANILISLSQISEALCILLIPFCLKRFGIKNVMLMAGRLDVHPLDDRLRRGVRLLQRLGLALRQPGDRRKHPLLGPGSLHDDDQRSGRHHRHARRTGRREPLRLRHGGPGQRNDAGLVDLVADLRRIRAGGDRGLRAAVPVQAPARKNGLTQQFCAERGGSFGSLPFPRPGAGIPTRSDFRCYFINKDLAVRRIIRNFIPCKTKTTENSY